MSLPWLSDDYKPSTLSKSPLPDKKSKDDDVIVIRSSRSRSRNRSRSYSSSSSSRSRSGSRSKDVRKRSRSPGRLRGRGRGWSRGKHDRAKRRRKHSGSDSSESDRCRPAASSRSKFVNARLFVAGINSKDAIKEDLVRHFGKYGNVIDLLIHPKNYAFVQYLKEDEARLAVEGENGSTFQGYKMDVKLAKEGKQQGSGARGGRGRGGRGGRGRGDDRGNDRRDLREDGFDRWQDDYHRPGSRGRRGSHAPYPGQFGMRDPYFPPPPSDAFLRGYPDPWGPPSDEPYRLDPYADPYRAPAASRPVNVECQIFLVSNKLREYGQIIEDLVRDNNILTGVSVMPEGCTATDMLADFSDRKGLFAIFVNAQNELHRSLTLNILHGTPQEHRNMPLKAAVELIGKSFEEYVDELREKAKVAIKPSSSAVSTVPASRVFLPPPQEVTYLLNLLADDRALSVSELDDVIKYLKARRDKLIDAESRPLASEEAALARSASASEASKVPTTEELTNKLLSIFSSASSTMGGMITTASSELGQQHGQHPVPYEVQYPQHSQIPYQTSQAIRPSAPQPQPSQVVAPPQPSQPAAPPQPPQTAVPPRPTKAAPPPQPAPGTSQAGSSVINFDNPNVQKALDNLIQSSPALLKTFSTSSSQSAPAAEPLSIESVSRLVGRSSMQGYGAARGADGGTNAGRSGHPQYEPMQRY